MVKSYNCVESGEHHPRPIKRNCKEIQASEPEQVMDTYAMILNRGATVPDFLVRDSANAKPSRFRDTKKVYVSSFPQSNRPTNRK